MEFCPDEETFLAWRSRHPGGQVLLVSERTDEPGVITHRATCDRLATAAHASAVGASTNAWACFETGVELDEWSTAYLSVVPSACPACLPSPERFD